MTFALVLQQSDNRWDAHFTVVPENFWDLVTVTVHRLQLEKVSCHSFAMLHVVTAATPLELLCTARVGKCRSSLRCTLTSCHLALCARPRYLVGECGGSQSMNECSFFVNLLHHGMYLLESWRVQWVIERLTFLKMFRFPFASMEQFHRSNLNWSSQWVRATFLASRSASGSPESRLHWWFCFRVPSRYRHGPSFVTGI